MREIELESICKCGKVNKIFHNITQIELLETCLSSIWNSKIVQELKLNDELKKDLAITLFIQVSRKF